VTTYTGTRRRKPARLQTLPMPLPARRTTGAHAAAATFAPPPARPRGYRGRRRREGTGVGAALLAGACLMGAALTVFATAIQGRGEFSPDAADLLAVLFGLVS
jgi:hypothetical protein